MLDLANKTLDQVPLTIQPCVIVTQDFGPLMRGFAGNRRGDIGGIGQTGMKTLYDGMRFHYQHACTYRIPWLTPNPAGAMTVKKIVMFGVGNSPLGSNFPPTSTPTATMTPTETPNFGCDTEERCFSLPYYYVNCELSTTAKVRNFPSGFITPEGGFQLDGRIRLELSPGTVVIVYDTVIGSDGISWARISEPWESYYGDSLWIRMKSSDNVTDTLISGTSSPCQGSTLDLTATPYPTPHPSFPTQVPGCIGTPTIDCMQATPGISTDDVVSFVLACEAWSDAAGNYQAEAFADALGIAHVVYNRMQSLTYAGSSGDVVRQNLQFSCFDSGSNPTLGLDRTDAIDPNIRALAAALGQDNEPALTPFDVDVDYLGLYTFGVPGSDTALAGTPGAIATWLAPFCAGNTSTALSVYLATAPFGSRPNATVFFSSYTGCVYVSP